MNRLNQQSEGHSIQQLQMAFEQFNRLSASLCTSVEDLNLTANQLTRPIGPGDSGVNNSGNRQPTAVSRMMPVIGFCSVLGR